MALGCDLRLGLSIGSGADQGESLSKSFPKIDMNANIHWLNNKKQYHCVHRPAFDHTDGSEAWYLNGIYHRLDGPAVTYSSGTKLWFQDGLFHRTDGPAIERVNGIREWWVDGRRRKDLE